MSAKINLSIPEPCHEKWDAMHPTDKGRFCDACQKQVIDFTGMSDEQVIAFFRKPSTGSLCGRFMPEQLGRDLVLPRKRIPWVKYFFNIALPAFLFTSKAAAQGLVRPGTTITQEQGSQSEKKISGAPGRSTLLAGRVLDNKGNGIPYASVMIKGSTIGTAADSSGYFRLVYEGSEKQVVLESSSIGFQQNEITVFIEKQTAGLSIELAARDTLPEVVVTSYGILQGKLAMTGGISMVRTSVIDTVKNYFLPPKFAFNIYPNPAHSNGPVKVQLTAGKGGVYNCQLFTISGQLITGKEVLVDSYAPTVALTLPSISAGVYLIRMTNKTSRKSESQQLLVE